MRRERLGALIRKLRRDRGMTQRDLAGVAGLSLPVMRAVELGHKYSAASLEDVALALGLPPGAAQAYLRGDDGAMPTPLPAHGAVSPQAVTAVTAARHRLLEATPQQLVEIMGLVEEVQGREAARAWMEKAIRMREAAAERPEATHRRGAG